MWDFEIANMQGVTRDMVIINMKDGSAACLYGEVGVDDDGNWFFYASKDVIRYKSNDSQMFEDLGEEEKERLMEKISLFDSPEAIRCEFVDF